MAYYRYTIWTYQDYPLSEDCPDGTRRYGTQEFYFGVGTDLEAYAYAADKLRRVRRHHTGVVDDRLYSIMGSLSEEARECVREHAQNVSRLYEEGEDKQLLHEDLRRVLESAAEVFQGDDLEMWIDASNKKLDGKTPRKMVEERNTGRVLALLEALKDGVHD